jgi:hypothetical protein
MNAIVRLIVIAVQAHPSPWPAPDERRTYKHVNIVAHTLQNDILITPTGGWAWSQNLFCQQGINSALVTNQIVFVL